MSSKEFFGVLTVNDQKYVIPLKDIMGIESTVNVKKIKGENMLAYQNQDILIYDLILLKQLKAELRKLSIIIDGETKKALQVDNFDSMQLDLETIQELPDIMVNKDSVVTKTFYDEDSEELLFMLTYKTLMNYLDKT
jgi:hypothetical protein